MRVSTNWLKEFVELPPDPRQLKADLTMVGLNVEAVTAVGDDWVLEVEVTTNRPDCLSHYGVAREVATLYRKPLKHLEFVVKETGARSADEINIQIADPDLCARYCGRVVQNVRVEPSPDWLAKRLEAVGQRPINNVADITNYVLMELGQPLHAFDLARLRERKIIVRRALPGELLRTLEGTDRALTNQNLVIADAQRPVALAGVMGGEDSQIFSTTRAVLLEGAWFDPTSIRRTAQVHGMHTEASHRFERGADIEMAPLAIDRAAALVAELTGGEVLRGLVDVYPKPRLREVLFLRRSEVRRILGTEIPWEEVERTLRSLGFVTERRGTEGWRVTPPTFRLDVSREIDLVEEAARHFGYDRLPSRIRTAPPRLEHDTLREKELAVSNLLCRLGYFETIQSSMIDPEETSRFSAECPVILANPLSQDASALRSSAAPSMIHALRWNLDRDQNDIRLFESGKVYWMAAPGAPRERRVLSLGLSGRRRPASLHDTERLLDFFDLKGDLEAVLGLFEIPQIEFGAAQGACYESTRSGRFTSEGEVLANFGCLSREMELLYKLRQPAWLAEVDFERLLAFPLRSRVFHPFSKFPSVERDFSLVIPEAVSFASLEAALRSLKLEEIQRFYPVDLFRGGSLPAGHYSLLLRVTFQSPTHTLTSEEIALLSERLRASFEPLGVGLRG
jgi:phenylalanyl-tRNA synthetase beta chain